MNVIISIIITCLQINSLPIYNIFYKDNNERCYTYTHWIDVKKNGLEGIKQLKCTVIAFKLISSKVKDKHYQELN